MFGNMANMNANGTMYAPGQGSHMPVTISQKTALATFDQISQKMDQISISEPAPDQRKYVSVHNDPHAWMAICKYPKTEKDQWFKLDSAQGCDSDSTGNFLGSLFFAFHAAKGKLEVQCQDETTVQAYLQYISALPSDSFTGREKVCSCRGYAHTCQHMNYVVPLVVSSLRHMATEWHRANKQVEFDDAVIHVRCGDILKYRHHTEYGFSPYWVYADSIPRNVRSIGILSSPTEAASCRKKDCPFTKTCETLLVDLKAYLTSQYPNTPVHLRHNEPNTPVSAFARMVMARVTICNPSTFCLFPTIACHGKGFLVESPKLAPWIKQIDPAESNVTVLETPFLSMQPIVDQKMGASDIIDWVRQPLHITTTVHQDNWIVQYGPPRTATTLQFQALCTGLFLRLNREGKTEKLHHMQCANDLKWHAKWPGVSKTHLMSWVDNVPKTVPVYATSNGTDENLSAYNLIRTVSTKDLEKHGLNYSLYCYQEPLGLTDVDMEIMLEYFRYWDVLRLCCGKQMSADWRQHLDPRPGYQPHHSTHSPYHSCALYDISAVESSFRSTTLYKLISDKSPKLNVLLRPAGVDDELDGTYCQRYNDKVRVMHLKFNEARPGHLY
jgi:hypothetical protein